MSHRASTRKAVSGAAGQAPEIQAFREFAGSHFGFLEEEASRLLAVAEAEGILPPRRRSPGGLADETLLLAWSRSAERPVGSTLAAWLQALLAEVVETAAGHVRETTPEVPPRVINDDLLDDDATSLQWRQCLLLGLLLEPRDPVVWEDELPLSWRLRPPRPASPRPN